MSSIGSPKKRSPPCSSICSRPRWIAPIDADDTLPYCVLNCAALSPTNCRTARRSLRSSSSRPLSSATLKISDSTPSCVSLRFSRRDSSSGPMSDTVARTGWPCSPHTSHSVTGHAPHCGSGRLCSSSRFFILSLQLARLGDAGEVALDVRHEHRHADAREALRELLQRHGLAGAGRAGDAAVAIGERGKQREIGVAGLGDDQGFGHGETRLDGSVDGRERRCRMIDSRPFREPHTPEREQHHGRSLQVGQHPASQEPPGRQAQFALDQDHP